MTDRFSRIGNNLSADFANTVAPLDHPDGALRSAKDVVDFLVAAGAIATAEAAALRKAVAAPAAGERFLASALRLRGAVIDALHAIERGRALDPATLAQINAVLATDAGYLRLEHRRGTAYALAHYRTGDDAAADLVPIARDIATLVATPGVPVRQCAGEGCVRHFYDDSRTGKRRWCEMAICGNRAKAAAFTARRAGSNRA